MTQKTIKISKKELEKIDPPGKLDNYNDIYLDYNKFLRVRGDNMKFDFLRDMAIKEGNLNGIGLNNDKLDHLWNLIEYKELRKDFVSPKELKRMDMMTPDLVTEKGQKWMNQYHAQVSAGDMPPRVGGLTTDMKKPAYSELREQLIWDFGTLNSIVIERNAEIKGRELTNKYRCDVDGTIPTTTDMVNMTPVESANKLKRLEAIYRRFEQGEYLVEDMDVKTEIGKKKPFLVNEIRRLKGQLIQTDLTSVEKREVNDLVDTLIDRKLDAVDFFKKKWTELRERYNF